MCPVSHTHTHTQPPFSLSTSHFRTDLVGKRPGLSHGIHLFQVTWHDFAWALFVLRLALVEKPSPNRTCAIWNGLLASPHLTEPSQISALSVFFSSFLNVLMPLILQLNPNLQHVWEAFCMENIAEGSHNPTWRLLERWTSAMM